jgi:hypothetical protein
MVDYFFTPKRFVSDDLNRVGVSIASPETRTCECEDCGEQWDVPELLKGDRLPKGSWKCPNGCNEFRLRIRSMGLEWVLWQLPDGILFAGHVDGRGRMRIYDLEKPEEETYGDLARHCEEGRNVVATGLEWDIHQFDDGTVYVSENYGDAIFVLKRASDATRRLYRKGKSNQYSEDGDLGMHE